MDGASTPEAAADLAEVWIPVGLPGFPGDTKHRRQAVLDERFGADGWRIGHVVRGGSCRRPPPSLEYEEAYRQFLRDRPALVRFLVTVCGNVYDDRLENVHEPDAYDQPDTVQNHYQDISVRRVISELVDDPAWPDVVETPVETVDLVDLGTGASHRAPRARGFRGRHLLQIRDPLSPGYVLNPAVVPVHDPALITTLPERNEWYHLEGCGHLSVEAFWQTSKVIEVFDQRLEGGQPPGADRAVHDAVIAGQGHGHHRGHRQPLPRTTGRFSPVPTDRIAPCGSLMIEPNDLMPNMPRFEIEKVPPWNSSGFSFLVRARSARSLASMAICARPFARRCG